GSESGSKDQLFEMHRDLLAVEGASTLLRDYAAIQDEQLQQDILATVKSLVRLEQSRISAPIEKPPAAETPTGHWGRIRGRTP
ncbi:MAG TPA: hypothetical protein VGO18_23425, partial [Steroidobacteraceae bacterium]|nr:hypothetical protein [Steroidobacteraceae bacterium]